MSQQKIDHRLLNHFLKLKIFDGLGRKQKSLEDVEDLLNNLEEEHLLLKTQQHLRKVCAEKGADEYQKSLEGALVQLRGAAAEIICNADTILRGDTNIKRGERISRQKREEYNMALKKPEAGVDYECVDAHQHVDKAIQTKWYSNASSKTIFTNDISTTLIDGLHWPILEIWTNASKVDSDVIKDNVVVSCRNSLSNRLTPQYLSNIKNLIKGSAVKPQKPLTPLWYQKIAVKACLKAFEKSDRGQLNVPCGWGKTLAGLWIGEGLGSKKTLALCPSKDLCRQILSAWVQNGSKKNVKRLVVCSDETVSHDALAVYEDELDFAVVKDSDKLKELTQDCAEYEIICTYQSISKLIEAELDFDYGFFDEAHRTTQPDDHLFALGLFDRNIKIEKRLFATATRRFIHSRNSRCNTMEDESVYGPVFYQMSFSEAVRTGRSRKNDNVKIISPVKIVTNKITNQDLDRELIKHGVTRVGWDLAQTRMVASIIGFLKAVDTLNLKKSFIYTNRVNSAERLANDPANGISQFTDKIKAFHVNGNMRSSERQREFTSFLEQEYSVITNARCLNEGVDCPLVDCVAFFNPRKSVIDIVQSVGRAMRVDKNNPDKVGCIYVNVFEDAEENTDQALYDSPYELLVDVILAMASHDDSLQDLLNKWLEDVGGGGDGDFPEIFEVIDGDDVDLEELRNSIVSQVMTVFRNKESSRWSQKIGLAKKIKEKLGHVNLHDVFSISTRASDCLAEDPLITPRYKRFINRVINHPEFYSKSQLEELNELGLEFDPALQRWKICTKLISNIFKKYSLIGRGTIDWDSAKDNLDEWSEGHIKSLEDFEKFKSNFAKSLNKIVKCYENTINDNSSIERKPRSARQLSTSHLEESQMNHLKEIEWIPKLLPDHTEHLICDLLDKYVEESKSNKKRGGDRWNSEDKSAGHMPAIRAEEMSGKIILPSDFEYEGVALTSIVRQRVRPQGLTKSSTCWRSSGAEARRQKTINHIEKIGIWVGEETQDEFIWKQGLKNWNRVNSGLTDNEEDVEYAKAFDLLTTKKIKDDTLSEKQKELLEKCNWESHRVPTVPQGYRIEECIDILTKMDEELGYVTNCNLREGSPKKGEGNRFKNETDKDRYYAIQLLLRHYKNNKLTKNQISRIENFNYWTWDTNHRPENFRRRVSLAKIVIEKNPNMQSWPSSFRIDNPFPFNIGKTQSGSSFDVGAFLRRVIRDSKEKSGIPSWQTKILHEELGEKWEKFRLPKRKVLTITTMKAIPKNYQKESYRIFLGKAPASSTRRGTKDVYIGGFFDRCESEKALVELQKRLDKNPDIDPLKLKKDFEEKYLKK